MGNESVIICVGPERKRYLIHKDLLTKQSEFFNKVLNGNFKEAEENLIYLEEESPAAFDLLVGWLYEGRIPIIGPPFAGYKAAEVDTTVRYPLSPGVILQPEHNTTVRYPLNPGVILQPYHTQGTSYRRFLGLPPIVNVGMGMSSPVTLPKNEGTGQVAYQPHIEPSTVFQTPAVQPIRAFDKFEHISARKEYRKWSPEELRAADYNSYENSRKSAMDKLTAPRPFTHKGHIPGIPHSLPLSTTTAAEETHQLALLNLCLLAESFCWDQLFNWSMSAYLLGEATLSHRPLPATHIALIHNRAHAKSPCRAFAADIAVYHLKDPSAQALYAELSHEYPTFLEDMFASLGANPALRFRDPTRRPACAYHVHATNESCDIASLNQTFTTGKGNADLFDRRPGEGFVAGLVGGGVEVRSGFGQQQHTRTWMDWREMSALEHRGLDWEF
jgi:hypothetical protein